MKDLWQLSYRRGDYEHAGYEYFTTSAKAEKAGREFVRKMRHGADFEIAPVPVGKLTKARLVHLLNTWASHADNG